MFFLTDSSVREHENLVTFVNKFSFNQYKCEKVFLTATENLISKYKQAPSYLVSLADKSVLVQLSTSSNFEKFKGLMSEHFKLGSGDIKFRYGPNPFESFAHLGHSRHIKIELDSNYDSKPKSYDLKFINRVHLKSYFKNAHVTAHLNLDSLTYDESTFEAIVRSFNNVSRLIRAVKNIIEKLEEQIDGISLKNQPLKNSPKAVCVELKNSPQDFDCEFDCESGNCSENLTIYKGFAEQFIRDLNWLQPNSFNKKKLPKGLNLLKFSTFKWLCYASKAISDIKKILKIKPAGDPYFLTTMSSIIIKNLNLTFEQIEKDEFKVNEDVKLSIKRRLAYASKSLEKYLSKLHKNCHSLPRYFLYRLTNIGSLG